MAFRHGGVGGGSALSEWTTTDASMMETILYDLSMETDDVATATDRAALVCAPPSPMKYLAQTAFASPHSTTHERVAPFSEYNSSNLRDSSPTQTPLASSSSSSASASSCSTPTVSMDSEAERRARHREVQRRFVQRKKEEIEKTKRKVEYLETKYHLLQLANEEQTLIQEHKELQEQVSIPRETPIPSPEQVAHVMEDQMNLIQDSFEPLTFMEWKSTVQRNIKEHYAMVQDPNYASTGAKVMGWIDWRKQESTTIKFMLAKEFPNVRTRELWTRTWNRLVNPETHPLFFPPVFTIKVRLLQRIDDDGIVILRALYNPQTGATSYTLETICRIRVGGDYLICGRSLKNNRAHACLGPNQKWLDSYGVFMFHALREDDETLPGCRFRHSGILQNFVATTVRYWLMEMFFFNLRFESAMIAPVFALPSQDGDDNEAKHESWPTIGVLQDNRVSLL